MELEVPPKYQLPTTTPLSTPPTSTISTPSPTTTATWNDNSNSNNSPRTNNKPLAERYQTPESSTIHGTYDYLTISLENPGSGTELRTKFRRLGITTSRLLDIHYPTKNALAILVHNDFTAEFLEHMTKFDIRPINDFDPNDPAHLQDPEYTSVNLTEDDKATHMITILNQRMRRTLEYIRTPLQRAVGTYFVQQGWIDETELVEILTPTTPDTEMNDVDTSFLTPSNSTDGQADI
ncbi:hypothetical protein BC941DRAFT_477419 [Chlamydoabsidia padenii]|nr:hypothetical protein BC941DRAFT_477419 [Chlamydoabsidia padenii]